MRLARIAIKVTPARAESQRQRNVQSDCRLCFLVGGPAIESTRPRSPSARARRFGPRRNSAIRRSGEGAGSPRSAAPAMSSRGHRQRGDEDLCDASVMSGRSASAGSSAGRCRTPPVRAAPRHCPLVRRDAAVPRDFVRPWRQIQPRAGRVEQHPDARTIRIRRVHPSHDRHFAGRQPDQVAWRVDAQKLHETPDRY